MIFSCVTVFVSPLQALRCSKASWANRTFLTSCLTMTHQHSPWPTFLPRKTKQQGQETNRNKTTKSETQMEGTLRLLHTLRLVAPCNWKIGLHLGSFSHTSNLQHHVRFVRFVRSCISVSSQTARTWADSIASACGVTSVASSHPNIELSWATKSPYCFPLYWLFNRESYNGIW